MSFIRMIPFAEATGRLADLFRRLSGSRGAVDHILWIHGLDPASMEHHLRYYAHMMRGPSPLTRAQRESIAVAVSAANDCFY
jgi:alkylhydroperoxidase family enzyme